MLDIQIIDNCVIVYVFFFFLIMYEIHVIFLLFIIKRFIWFEIGKWVDALTTTDFSPDHGRNY